MVFLWQQLAAQMETMRPAQVKAVTGGGPTNPAGTVNVQPLVSQIDGNGNPTPHGIVNGIPWFRLQGGNGAFICDPQVGDIGYVVVANRDMSLVVKNKKLSNPGSFRRFDLADGVYVGGILNAAPTSYICLNSDGSISIVDGFGNKIISSVTGFAVTTSGDFTVNGISVTLHTHAVSTAPGETGPPVG